MGKISPTAAPRVLDIIQREDRRLARFLDELLDLGRIQSGQIFFNFEEVNLGDVLREVASELGPELTRSGSALSLNTSGRPVGQWDRFRLTQVLTNLLTNAIKFGEGKPIEVGVSERNGIATLKVKDHGIGIAPEVLDKIFQPFGRGVSARNYGGLGLGLFIVKTIVDGLGGKIRVESRPKEGSTFTVELKTGHP
jgi:signal transduction histidine kinase